MAEQPVRVGDRFTDSAGLEWRVINTFPFGKVDLFHEPKARFLLTTVRQLRIGKRTRVKPAAADNPSLRGSR